MEIRNSAWKLAKLADFSVLLKIVQLNREYRD